VSNPVCERLMTNVGSFAMADQPSYHDTRPGPESPRLTPVAVWWTGLMPVIPTIESCWKGVKILRALLAAPGSDANVGAYMLEGELEGETSEGKTSFLPSFLVVFRAEGGCCCPPLWAGIQWQQGEGGAAGRGWGGEGAL
jgi:hypothetical protein